MIRVTAEGLDRVIAKYERLERSLRKPEMKESVRGVARVWERSFSGEGSMVGGWLPLSQMTQDLRRKRGFPPRHPILVQTGNLRAIAIRGLTRVVGPTAMSGSGVAVRFSQNNSGATLTARGTKVSNQYRTKIGRFRSPARPFWFVNQAVADAAAEGLNKWLIAELRRQ